MSSSWTPATTSKVRLRVLSEEIVVQNQLTFITGYRYELYCISKATKTTQCTLHCDTSAESARCWNEDRPDEDRYSKEVFDALVMRYEPPDSRNRWDSPLFTIQPEDELPFDDICNVLFNRKAPPPNMSTQSVIVPFNHPHSAQIVFHCRFKYHDSYL